MQWKTEDESWEQSSQATLDGAADRYKIAGLVNDTAYDIRVIAESLLGTQTVSNEVRGKPHLIAEVRNLAYATETVTHAVSRRCLTWQDGRAGPCEDDVPWWQARVRLTWDQPADTSNISAYRIERKNTVIWARPRIQSIDRDANTVSVIEAPDIDITETAFVDVGRHGSGIFFTGFPGEDRYGPYTYRITSIGPVGQLGNTAEVTLERRPQGPGRPANMSAAVRAAGHSAHDVTLSWDPPDDGAAVTGYRVYRYSRKQFTEGRLAKVRRRHRGAWAYGHWLHRCRRPRDHQRAHQLHLRGAGSQRRPFGTAFKPGQAEPRFLLGRHRHRLVTPGRHCEHSLTQTNGGSIMKTIRAKKIGIIAALVLGLIGVGIPPTSAQGGTTTEELRWSADVRVEQLASVSIGAATSEQFTNIGGSLGLQARSFFYHIPGRALRLRFAADVPGEDDLILQVGDDLELPFQAGHPSYAWQDVDIDWAAGQTIAVRIVSPGGPNNPATGEPTISGTARVKETLTAGTSGIADEDGLGDVEYAYQWVTNGMSDYAEIEDATSKTYTVTSADVGKVIKVRVSFADDLGNKESLLSEPTEPVDAVANTPPSGLPAVSGTPQVKETLTADTSGISDDNGLDDVAYSYQWMRNDGTDDTDIAEETSKTYTVADADVGKTIKVRVSFTDNGGNYESLTSAASAVVVAAPNTQPSGLPAVSGTPQVKETLTADTSDISDDDGLDDVSYGYQWMRNDGTDDTDIAEETSRTYTVAVADVGKTIKVRVSFTDVGGNYESLTSAASAVVVAAPNTPPSGLPAVSGTPAAKETLTADTSGISDDNGLDDVAYGYQWMRNDGTGDADIAEETSGTYTVAVADVGKTIKVRVSFTDDGGNRESLTSLASAVVAGPAPTAAPGALQVRTGASGELVVSWEAPRDGPPATGYRVQWKSGTEDFDGSETSTRQGVLADASALTYAVTGLADGSEYSVRVIAYNPSGDGPASVEATAVPQPPNVVIIFVDDMGYEDVSFNGATQIRTTNLDRLAREGSDLHQRLRNVPCVQSVKVGAAHRTLPCAFRHGIQPGLQSL